MKITEVIGRLRTNQLMLRQARSNKGQVLVRMPCMQFLRLTTDGPAMINDILDRAKPVYQYNRWIKAGDKPEYAKFRSELDQEPFYPITNYPHLDIALSRNADGQIVGTVVGHEGRHRAASVIK